MNPTKKARPRQWTEPGKEQKKNSPDHNAVAVDTQPGLLHEIGSVRFVRLPNGRLQVLYPELGGTEFPAEQEAQARELFQSAARREKLGTKASGFDPCAKALESPHSDGIEDLYDADVVRRLVRHDLELSDYLGLCRIRLSDLLAWIDEADGEPEEKTRIRQKVLRFQAPKRLEATK